MKYPSNILQQSIDKIIIIFHLYFRWQSITVKSQNCAVTPENSTFLTTSGFILIFVTVVWLPYFSAIAAQNSELSLFRSLLFYTRCPQCSAFVSAKPWCTVVGYISFNRKTLESFNWTLQSIVFEALADYKIFVTVSIRRMEPPEFPQATGQITLVYF